METSAQTISQSCTKNTFKDKAKIQFLCLATVKPTAAHRHQHQLK